MFTCALKACTSRSFRRVISSCCCLSTSRLASSLSSSSPTLDCNSSVGPTSLSFSGMTASSDCTWEQIKPSLISLDKLAKLSFHNTTVSRQKSTCDHVHIFFDKSANSCERRQSCVYSVYWRTYTCMRVLPVEIAPYGVLPWFEKWHPNIGTLKGAEIGLSKYLSTSDNCEGIANALGNTIRTVCMLLREKVFMLLHYLSALTVLFLSYSLTESLKWSYQ